MTQSHQKDSYTYATAIKQHYSSDVSVSSISISYPSTHWYSAQSDREGTTSAIILRLKLISVLGDRARVIEDCCWEGGSWR